MTKVNNDYYTYAFLRKDGSPYYIGKGRDKRIYEKWGRTIKPPKDKSRIIFLKQNLTEEEAFKHEIYMIALYGRKDLGTGILHNLTDGGEGPSGYTHTEETRKKISEAMKGKKHTPETIKKISETLSGENHPNYDKKENEVHKKWRRQKIKEGWKNVPLNKKIDYAKNYLNTNTQRIEVEIEGIKFKSINEAARWAVDKYNIGRNTAIRYIKEGRSLSNKKMIGRLYNGTYTGSKYL